MPASEHVEYPAWKRTSRNVLSDGSASKSSAARRPRRGMPVDVNAAATSILSPLLYRLPSISGITTLKEFLPASSPQGTGAASSSAAHSRSHVGMKSIWQDVDLGDGHGRRHLLLISSVQHALQIFAFTSNTIPDNPHVQETWAAPEEILSLAKVNLKDGDMEEARVLDARLLDTKGQPMLAIVTVTTARKAEGKINAAIVSLRTGVVVKLRELGVGSDAALLASARVLVVGVTRPSPTIHILHPDTLESVRRPLSDLSSHPRSGLPIFDLSHRLLAFATSEPPRHPGPHGLGSIVTAKSSTVYASRPATSPGLVSASQGDILTSAMDIGGGVARGVWAGLKMSARAANAARAGRLARSAPAEATLGMEEEHQEEESGSELLGVNDQSGQTSDKKDMGLWIKIIDLFPRAVRSTANPNRETGASTVPQGEAAGHDEVIAHFRLPPSRSNYAAMEHGLTQYIPAVSHLSFSPSGTHLFAADTEGRSFHILELQPTGVARDRVQGEVKGEVWDLYDLRRGNTAADVEIVRWADDGRWIGVGTGRGTIHVFPLNASGGAPTAAAHVSARTVNPTRLYPLSTIIHPSARIRTLPQGLSAERSTGAAMTGTACVFAFTNVRRHPTSTGAVCQDLTMFRSATARLEVSRLVLKRRTLVNQASIPRTDVQRRGSGLTEMMRNKAGLADQSDLCVEHSVRAGWVLPLEVGDDGDLMVGAGKSHRPVGVPIRSSLARAEIQTHIINPRILPSSIYASRQVDFYAARPIDDYSPLSIIDLDARVHRLKFRPEVEVRSTSPEANSFDEPLLTALHSIMISPTHPEIPGLPNGYPNKPRWRSSMPIRQVASGLGEGVGRVRMEYARAQHSRMKRRLSEAGANSLSFEEDAVFASLDIEDEGSNTNSSPSSGILPESTDAGSQGVEEEAEWGEGWEEEYRKAVEDDGGPEELVLGLMDEEEEERRKWESKGKGPAVYKV